MHEFNDELDGPSIALLELYRDAGAPPAEVEDRLLARIEAQAAIEADLEGDDHELIGAEPQPATETGVRPLTAVLIAIVAFAAGVALTVGLRAQVAQLVQDPFAPSVAPMTAEDPPAHEIAEPPAKDACGAAVTEEPDEEEEPVESEERDAEEEEDVEEDDEPTARSFVVPGEDDEPDDVSEGESIDDEPGAYGYGYALSPWSGGREDENETRSSSKRGSRSTRIGGYWAPTSIGSSSSSSPSSRPSTNGGARGPSTPKPSGGGNGKPVGNNGGGDRPPPPKPDPSTPPPPTSNPGNDDPPPPDDRPPEEPPLPDEPEPPPSDEDPCAFEEQECSAGAQESCAYDPLYCEEYQLECDFLSEECPYLQCDQSLNDCLLEAESICLQDPEMLDPELQNLCMQQRYEQCSNDYNVCYGDEEVDPGQGVELDEYP